MNKNKITVIVVTIIILVLAAVLLIDRPGHTPYSPLRAPDSPLVRLDPIVPRAYFPLAGRVSEYVQAKSLGFEGTSDNQSIWYPYPSQVAFEGRWDNIWTGYGWKNWWVGYQPCASGVTGRPEAHIITDDGPGTPYHLRVAGGRQAQKWFQFWRCGYGGVYQRMMFPPGRYRVCASAHSWYSNCSTRPHATEVLDYDCETVLEEAHNYISIGVDVNGIGDLYSPSLVWGPEIEQYGLYVYDAKGNAATNVCSGEFEMRFGGWVDVWLRSQSTHSLKHGDLYVDNFVIMRVVE